MECKLVTWRHVFASEHVPRLLPPTAISGLTLWAEPRVSRCPVHLLVLKGIRNWQKRNKQSYLGCPCFIPSSQKAKWMWCFSIRLAMMCLLLGWRPVTALRWCESCRYSQWLGSVHNIASLLSATVPYPSYSIIPAIFNEHDRQISAVYSWVLKHASIPERSSDHSADYCAATGAQALVVLSSAGKCCMHCRV
jgi:hypothetical protein